ncbi:MAG TPA: hypothetical protein VIM79_24270 [Niastella sp.]
MIRSRTKHTTIGAGWNLKNRFILAFFHGLLVASIFYTAIESHYESDLFANIVSTIRSTPAPGQSEDAFLLEAMHATHQLLSDRQPFFNRPFTDFKTNVSYPVTFDLMTANGACGSYARVLARILQEAHIKVRIPEMVVNGKPGGHIIIEALTKHGWVVLDAVYDLHFITPAGTMAGFSEIQNNWAYYKSQVPANYNMDYRYEDVHYTNWNKIPVLLPMVKKISQWVLGEERTSTLSLRTYFLQPYKVAFCGFLGVYIFILLLVGYHRFSARIKKRSAQSSLRDLPAIKVRKITA